MNTIDSKILLTEKFHQLGDWLAALDPIAVPPVEYPPVDPEDPNPPVMHGFHTAVCPDRNGDLVEYAFYIPRTYRHSGNSLIVVGDNGQTARGMFEANDWAGLLEKYETAAYFVTPNDSWSEEDQLDDLLHILRGPYANVRSCRWYASNYDAVYAIGLGTGAALASLMGVLFSHTFAAFAALGNAAISPELLEIIGKLPTADETERKAEVAIPAWIGNASGKAGPLVDYLKHACGVKEENLRNDLALVWRAHENTKRLCLNDQPVAEVWYSTEVISVNDAVIDRMLDFVTGYKRWGGYGNGHIRKTIRPEDCGLIRREITCGGLKRHWYVFEPTAYRKGLKKDFPMVMAIHGYSCHGAFYMENSSWQAVAEERGIIVVFPSGYPQTSPRSGLSPTGAWNSFARPLPDRTDDLTFLRQVVEIMEADYPIDKHRVYVTGHSNGSAMTQNLMRFAPELFAAFAGIGAMEAAMFEGKIAPPMPNDLPRPVWYIMGERDLFEADTLAEGSGNLNTVKNACKVNGADYDGASHYTSGIYRHLVAYDGQHRPMVRFTGADKWPHTVTPETSLMIWDEFFCKFVRNDDGTVTYIG